MSRPVLSTYRLQLRGPLSGSSFTLDDAAALVDYLDELGVTHLYLSPILTASAGSAHGYDVTDPTSVSAELGGPEAFPRVAAAARARGLGLIVDIVPNHVGVDRPDANRWWWDVLTHGRESVYASFFDIDWESDNGVNGRIALPVLGSDDDVADLTIQNGTLRLGDLVFPIAPGTGAGTGPQVHERQHYQLIGWRNRLCGYRRFFAITTLAGLRQEDRAVFEASHREVGRWFADGLVDGVRIDHPDGFSDPAGYLTWLRELVGPQAWIVVEKILATDEALEPTLPVAGTTGYDAMREIGGLFIDPCGADALTALYESSGVHYAGMIALRRKLKLLTATDTLASELRRVRRAIVRSVGIDHHTHVNPIANRKQFPGNVVRRSRVVPIPTLNRFVCRFGRTRTLVRVSAPASTVPARGPRPMDKDKGLPASGDRPRFTGPVQATMLMPRPGG